MLKKLKRSINQGLLIVKPPGTIDAFIGYENKRRKEVLEMKKLTKTLERLFTAAAFAEEGEHDMAREILREEERPREVDRVSPTARGRKELRAPGIKR